MRTFCLTGAILCLSLFCVSNAQPPAAKPKAAASRPSTCGGGVLNRKAVYMPVPLYARDKTQQLSQGMVTVRVTANENGFITKAEACSGPQELRYFAEAAAQRARIKQTFLSGVPVKIQGVLNYTFDSQTAFDAPYELPCYQTAGAVVKILNAHAIRLEKPERPTTVGKMGMGVSVQVLIDENGDVEKAAAVSGPESLRQAAVLAARNSKFRKFFACGKPRKLASILSYHFPGS